MAFGNVELFYYFPKEQILSFKNKPLFDNSRLLCLPNHSRRMHQEDVTAANICFLLCASVCTITLASYNDLRSLLF